MPADNWEHIINLVTGWTLPDRADIIDKSKGDGGIPWLNVSIKGVDNDRVAINSLHGDGNGATIQFWSGSGKGVKKHEANITFVGMEKGKQYWEASALVLRNLVYGNFSSANLNTSIPGAPSPEKGIDLHTFSQLAKSFDAAGDFFARHTEVIKQWAEALGSEQASWKGTAASAFWHMLDQLHTKYENYLSQLRPPGFTPANVSSSTGYVSTTLHGESLIGAEVALYKLVSDLYYYQQNFFWRRAAPIGITRPDSTTASFRAAADPRDILLELVRDITEWVGIHQAPFVYFEYTSMPTGDGGYAAYDTVTTLPGFQESTHWGALKDTSTWGGIANEAVSRWRDNVSKNLDELAIPSVAVLQKEWSRVLDPNWNTKFTFGDTTSGGLSAIVEREKADADKDKAAREADERSKEQQADADRRAAAAQKDADERYKKQQGDADARAAAEAAEREKQQADADTRAAAAQHDADERYKKQQEDAERAAKEAAGRAGASASGSSINLGGLPQSLSDFGSGAAGLGASITTLSSGLSTGLGLGAGQGTPGDLGGLTGAVPSTTGADGGAIPGLSGGLSTTATGASIGLPDGGALDPSSTLSAAAAALGSGAGLTGSGPSGTDDVPSAITTTSTGVGVPLNVSGGSLLSGLPAGGAGTLPGKGPNGSSVTLSPSGGLTTSFPDGSSQTVNPDGSVLTEDPSGAVTTGHVDPGDVLANPDGSTTTVTSTGQVVTDFPDGSSVSAGPDGGLTVTNPDGSSTTHLPNGMVQTVDADGVTHLTAPNGDVTTLSPSGGLTTSFPDGSSQTVNPDGSVLTEDPSGAVTTGHVDPGDVLTNPDGSTTTVTSTGQVVTDFPDGSSISPGPDGGLTVTNPDGSSTTHLPNGMVQTVDADGVTHLTAPNGDVTTQNADGSMTTDFPDGSSTTVTPDGSVTTTTGSGQTLNAHLPAGENLVNPDGSMTSVNADGAITTQFPDGSSFTVHPDGTLTTTEPTASASGVPNGLTTVGSGTSVPLPDLGSGGDSLLTTGSDGSVSSHYPSGAVATTGADGSTVTRFPDGSSMITGANGEFQAIPSPASDSSGQDVAGSLGAAAAAGAGASPAGSGADANLMGMMSPMMMMMGMARMGGGQGQGGQQGGERIREVYEDEESDGAFMPHQFGQGQRPVVQEDLYEEEEEDSEELLAPHGSASRGGRATATQNSSSWSADQDDVWGTEDGGMPASIGR